MALKMKIIKSPEFYLELALHTLFKTGISTQTLSMQSSPKEQILGELSRLQNHITMACMDTRNFLVNLGSRETNPLDKLKISPALPLLGFGWEAERVWEAQEGCVSAAAALEGVLGLKWEDSREGLVAAEGSGRGLPSAEGSAGGPPIGEGSGRGLPLPGGSAGGLPEAEGSGRVLITPQEGSKGV